MPNNTHIPICPYFRDEKKRSISCEDIFRSFPSGEAKNAWMEMFCDRWEYELCPYAAALGDMYERIDKGADMTEEQMKQQINAMKKELKYKAVLLGKADKRLEAKDQEIKDLRKKNREIESLRAEEYRKRRKAEIEVERHGVKATDQLKQIIETYKDVMCFLLYHNAPDGLSEQEVSAWAKEHRDAAYSVLRMPCKGGDMLWQLVTQEVKKDDTGKQVGADRDAKK